MIPIKTYAYIGPGMAGGIIFGILGFFAAIFIAIFGILYFPIKRWLNNRKSKNKSKKIK